MQLKATVFTLSKIMNSSKQATLKHSSKSTITEQKIRMLPTGVALKVLITSIFHDIWIVPSLVPAAFGFFASLRLRPRSSRSLSSDDYITFRGNFADCCL